MAYDRLYPMFDEWLAHGILCSTLANLWSKQKFKPQDFIPRRKKKQSPKQMFSKLKAFARKKE